MEITQEKYEYALERMEVIKEHLSNLENKMSNSEISRTEGYYAKEYSDLKQLYANCLIIKILYESRKKEGKSI